MSQQHKSAITISLFCLTVLGGSVSSGEMSPASVLIQMENWAPYYQPNEASIPSGIPILWVNPTASPHTVRYDGCDQGKPCLFDSGAVPPEASFRIPGLPPGRYPYHCQLHPIMRGELIVGVHRINVK